MLRRLVVFATHSPQVFISLLLYTKLDAILKIFLSELHSRHNLLYHQIGTPWCKRAYVLIARTGDTLCV